MSGEFRRYLFPRDHPRVAEVRGLDPYAYGELARTPATFTGGLVEGWMPLYRSDFRGVTEDATLRDGLYDLTPAQPGEQAPVEAMVAAAEDLLAVLDDERRARVSFPVDAVEWQTWANPEFVQFDTGLRRDLQPPIVREKALALMPASLSPEGYDLTHAMMLINGFLGEVVDLVTILNDFSYNVALYGTPDLRAPWGWQLFGHHCAVNCLVVDGRMALSPAFLGAEPDEIDAGPHAGLRNVFADRIDLGLALTRCPTRRSACRCGSQPGDVVYYRLQSPVLVAELDHHCGVFLDYDTPKPFHVHTVLRTPHGNDYGRAGVRQWQQHPPA